jgi:L-alanine-DL-glutamate epimerase-like enolase superfamily enzyme
MLEWDKNRIRQIHEFARNYNTQYTKSGHPLYYLDANGRYDSKERLLRLIEYTQKIKAFESIVLLEEPFPEAYRVDISEIPVRIAADESAHSDRDAAERIQMGYKAITLKPIAKTLSMSLKIAKIAYEKKIPCFCADLTVNPIMADINKCVAARLSPVEGVKIGIIETNGSQYYSDWERLKSYHPFNGADWIDSRKGIYNLNDDFYKSSGGILYCQSIIYLWLNKKGCFSCQII